MNRSVCASGRATTFYWRGAVAGLHIDTAVEALMATIRRPDRYTGNPYLDADNEAMFRARLETAEKGRLVPGDQVRAIRMNPSLRMYEIRWSEVQAIPVDPVSGAFGQRVENIQVRLYYVERGDAWVVGLLAHEKDVSFSVQDDIDALQDEMIRQAGAIAIAEEADAWGVPELGCRISPA